jgi:hypothetical protein
MVFICHKLSMLPSHPHVHSHGRGEGEDLHFLLFLESSSFLISDANVFSQDSQEKKSLTVLEMPENVPKLA